MKDGSASLNDNAQRIDECGYGVRLSTYEFTDDELHAAIDRLSSDRALAARLPGYLVPRLVREIPGDPGKRPL